MMVRVHAALTSKSSKVNVLGREKVRVEPYTRLARIYDFVMSHVDYTGWAEYLRRIDQRFKAGVNTVLDISCGTGSLCYELEKLGYQANGFDYNYEMVLVGLRKKKAGSRVRLWVADMVHPGLVASPDMIVSVYDSMNYLMERRQWETCLQNVYDALEKGGLYVFDISTLGNSKYVFNRYTQRERNRVASYIRKSRFDARNSIQKNDFEIRFKSDRNTVYCEEHRQRILPLVEVKEMITRTPFEVLGYFHNFTFKPGTDTSERVHFVLRK